MWKVGGVGTLFGGEKDHRCSQRERALITERRERDSSAQEMAQGKQFLKAND